MTPYEAVTGCKPSAREITTASWGDLVVAVRVKGNTSGLEAAIKSAFGLFVLVASPIGAHGTCLELPPGKDKPVEISQVRPVSQQELRLLEADWDKHSVKFVKGRIVHIPQRPVASFTEASKINDWKNFGNEEHPSNSTKMLATLEEYGSRLKRGGTFTRPAKRPSRHPKPFVLPIQAIRILQHQVVSENGEAGATKEEKERQRLQQPLQFPQLPSDAEINRLVNKHVSKESDSDDDSDDNDATGEGSDDEHHPVYWREQQQQSIDQWLATHPEYNVNHHSVNIKVAQLFQNSVHFGKCVAATTPSLNQPVAQFLIQYDDGDYALMSTGEFLNATVMYHRENRLRLNRQRRKPVDPPVFAVAVARLVGENVGAATWSEDLSEGVATEPVVIPSNIVPSTLPLDPTPTNQPSRHRYQVAWGPEESLSEVMGTAEALMRHHVYNDDNDNNNQNNNVTVHQAAKAKIVLNRSYNKLFR